ncbi:hypothetical protein PIB30_001086 [Stylosanthes scabra]|uniref:Uncharacterized protein n=1 Tax=Stylosanthes scabra TaxID=79078 RepID=A0ABU6U2S3_9FABA|nr:hypothetical protein [Stylosanthes scabra]
MGCCFSTTINTLNTKKDQNALKLHQPHPITTTPPPPPPPPVEEESVVKEVLSETPISKPQVSILTIETDTQFPKIQYSNCPIFNEAQEQVSLPLELEASHITQTCSISDSFFSTTATTTSTTVTGTETREDEATSKLRTVEATVQNLNRSQSKRSCDDAKSIGGGEQSFKSPARTLPEKRIPAIPRPARQRDSGQVHRDPGEGTGRRVRSPSAVGRFSGGNSGNQVKLRGNGSRRLAPVKSVVVGNGRKENDVVTHEESLENPHVSLECFIFL